MWTYEKVDRRYQKRGIVTKVEWPIGAGLMAELVVRGLPLMCLHPFAKILGIMSSKPDLKARAGVAVERPN